MSGADPLTAPAIAVPSRGKEVTLSDCARTFRRFASPKLIAAAIAASLVARLAAADWEWLDLAAIGGLIALQPFSEWLIHVGLLHAKPRKLGPLTVNLPGARIHRWHHRHPTALRGVLLPGPIVLGLLPLIAGVVWLLTWPLTLAGGDHTHLSLSGALCAFALLGTYEWCHFLIHSPYRPRSAYYRSVWRSHRLHHFKNEHYWFGVSSDAADRVLGTSPDHRRVPRSRTARDLIASSNSNQHSGGRSA
jgi:sterol desaturase/sphingolipid hydroxylase (fatty acid hydroxylase superfamily)